MGNIAMSRLDHIRHDDISTQTPITPVDIFLKTEDYSDVATDGGDNTSQPRVCEIAETRRFCEINQRSTEKEMDG